MKFRNSIVVMICMVAMMNMKNGEQVKEVHVLNIPDETVVEVMQETPVDLIEEAYYDSLEMLACCVEAEAGNQDYLGKRLVVDVILNRVESERFPNDIPSVITQKGQFAVHSSGAMYRAIPSEETYAAVREELKHRTDTEILFFSAHNYNKCCTPAYQHQDHYFGY